MAGLPPSHAPAVLQGCRSTWNRRARQEFTYPQSSDAAACVQTLPFIYSPCPAPPYDCSAVVRALGQHGDSDPMGLAPPEALVP